MMVHGQEYFDPELFEQARKMVCHYGLFSIANDRASELKDRWFEKYGEAVGCIPGDVRPTKILTIASRSVLLDEEPHRCDAGCDGLPESPFVSSSRRLHTKEGESE